jgi:hypothetical protein
MNGKGSKRRPQMITEEEMERRWDAAFGEAPTPPEDTPDEEAQTLK